MKKNCLIVKCHFLWSKSFTRTEKNYIVLDFHGTKAKQFLKSKTLCFFKKHWKFSLFVCFFRMKKKRICPVNVLQYGIFATNVILWIPLVIWTKVLERVELSQIIDIKRRKKWSHEDLAIYMRIYIRRERNSTKLQKIISWSDFTVEKSTKKRFGITNNWFKKTLTSYFFETQKF